MKTVISELLAIIRELSLITVLVVLPTKVT